MAITLADLRADGLKRWSARLWIGGQPYDIAEGLPVRTLSALRTRATCSVDLIGLPPGGKSAYIDLVLNDTKVERYFTGRTDQRSGSAARLSRTANLVDVLNLDRNIGSDLTWSNRAFADAVRDVLTAAGLSASQIDSIDSPGAAYALGPVYPIKVKASETVGQVLRNLMEFGGTAAYTTPAGRVRVVDNSGVPAGTSGIVYANGADLAAGEFGITDAGFSIEGNERAVKTFTATGPRTPAGAEPDGTFTAAGIDGRLETVSYPYLQSDALAQTIAQRELARRARDAVNVWIEAPLNPLLQPGDTILLRDASIGYPTNEPAMVTETATTADGGMRVQLSIGPSLIDGWGSSVRPPVVDFSMQIESQAIRIAGAGTSRYFVQCRDQSRDQSGGSIASRSWAASGTGASPTSSSDEAPLFLFTSLSGASIQLTATSSSGESATASKVPTAAETTVLNRTVSVAAGSAGWKVLTSTGWQAYTAAGSCTAVPPISPGSGLIAGFSSGAIYQSADALASAPTLLTTRSGAITCLWVNEGDPSHILAGHGTTLSRSTNGGASWASIGTFAATVTACQSSPSNLAELRVLAGAVAYISYNGGATWAAIVTGAGGSTARALASAPWGHAVAFSGAGAAGAVRFEEGYTVDWSGVAGGSQPASGLTAITPALQTESFIAAEGSIAQLIRDGDLDGLVFSASSGSGRVYRLTKSGSAYTAALLLTAADAGPGKIINGAAAYPLDTASATQIGYGGLAAPSTSAELVLGTVGQAPCGLWHRASSAWTFKQVHTSGNMTWLDVSPLNPDHWICGHSTQGYKLSTDAGATWSAITLVAPGGYSLGATAAPQWSATTPGAWACVGRLSAATSRLGVWRGTTTALSPTATVVVVPNPVILSAPAGAENELVVSWYISAYWYLSHISAADAMTDLYDASYTPGSYSSIQILARRPGSRGLLAYAFGGAQGYLWTPDYRTTYWSPTTGAVNAIGGLLPCGDGAIGLSGTSLVQVAGLWSGAPTITTLATLSASSPSGSSAVDARTQSEWMGVLDWTAGTCAVWDGERATTVVGPGSTVATSATLARAIIKRTA